MQLVARDEALDAAAKLCEARRQAGLAVSPQSDPTRTEHFAELEQEIRALRTARAAEGKA